MQTIQPGRRAAALLCISLLAGGCVRPAALGPARPGAVAGHVVVISIDGLRADAIEAANAVHLQGMMREGAWSLRAQTIFPSRTLPSHTSMLTGVPPSVHGITFNDERIEREGRVGVPTVFDVAQEAGLYTSAIFGKAKFRHLIHPGAPRDVQAPPGSEIILAPYIVERALQHLRFRRPNLLFIHIPDPDIAGHALGWMSLSYRTAVRRADGAVSHIVAAARRAYGDDVVVIVTADHGGHGNDHGTDEPVDMTIPWIAWGKGVVPGEIREPIVTMNTAATALWLLGVPVPSNWEGKPVTTAFQAPAPAASAAQ
ncbi:MAG TPA: ectonucleotide pyrophosphatase/phosphodiesterase [Longimicrobium sp.]|nr:ectonucleotide pyrophosphatase/phosphodiesterase [Longimicrobium sp.]